MVVFPAASRPTIKIRISFFPNCYIEGNKMAKVSMVEEKETRWLKKAPVQKLRGFHAGEIFLQTVQKWLYVGSYWERYRAVNDHHTDEAISFFTLISLHGPQPFQRLHHQLHCYPYHAFPYSRESKTHCDLFSSFWHEIIIYKIDNVRVRLLPMPSKPTGSGETPTGGQTWLMSRSAPVYIIM